MQESINDDLEELKNKHTETNSTKIQTKSSGDRITTSLSLAHQSKNKQTNKNLNKSHPIQSLHTLLDQP